MWVKRLGTILLGMWLGGSGASFAAPTGSHIDWEKGQINLVIIQSPVSGRHTVQENRSQTMKLAYKAAKSEFDHLVQSIRFDSTHTMQDFVLEDPYLKEAFSDVFYLSALNHQVVRANGSVVLDIVVPLFGELGFSRTLYFHRISHQETVRGKILIDLPDASVPNQIYTGLIVNAQDLNLSPSLGPQIKTADNTVIYSLDIVDFQAVMSRGLVRYYTSVAKAQKATHHVGNRPMMVNAIKVTGPFRTDLIVTDATGQKILTRNKWARFLEKCRVIIIR